MLWLGLPPKQKAKAFITKKLTRKNKSGKEKPIKLIIDTRETLPLPFRKNKFITEIVHEKLDVGDYACVLNDGHFIPIIFDRKAFGDLYGTMTNGYDRFKKAIIRSQESNIQLFIIVEGSLTEVGEGYKYSKFKGLSMKYKLFTLWAKYGVQTIFCTSRQEMIVYITQFFIACEKQYLRSLNEQKSKSK